MKLSKLLKDSVVYGFSSYLSLAVAIFLTPIYTRTLTKEEYGIMDLFTTWNNIFILIIPLGLTAAVLRHYKDFQHDETLNRKYLGTVFATLFGLVTIYFAIMTLFSAQIVDFYYKTGIDYTIYYLSYGIVAFNVLKTYFQSMNRISFRKYTFAGINIASFLIMSGLGFYLVVIVKMGVLGFFWAAFISSGIGFLLAIGAGTDFLKMSFDSKILKTLLAYSVPLLMVSILIKFTHVIDRYIINEFLDLKSVGEYSIVLRINNVFQLFVGAFTTAWFPYAMELKDEADRDMHYNRTHQVYLILFTAIAGLIMLFGKELFLFFAPDYLNVLNVTYVIVPSTLVAGCHYFYSLGINIKLKSKFFLFSSGAAFLVNFGLSWWFVSHIGLYGIAAGSLISIIVWVLIDYYVSKRLVNIRFHLIYLLLALVTLGIVALLANYLSQLIPNDLWLFAAKMVILLVVGISMFQSKFVKNGIEAIRTRKK